MRFNITLIALLTTLLWSCKKDHGNYKYGEIEAISITPGDSNFVIQQLETLNIPVTLEGTSFKADDYSYEWKAYTVATPNVGEYVTTVLSTDKDFNEKISLAPGSYYLQYAVTNKQTQLQTFKRYTLTVNGAFYEGWLVTANKDGKALVSFIRKDGTVFKDPVGDINSLQLKGKAIASYSGIAARIADITVFTDEQVYRFNANDFNLTGTTESMFNVSVDIAGPYYSINYLNVDQFIINNGNVHATLTPAMGAVSKYSGRFFGPDYEAFPYLMGGDRFRTVIYDNKNKRFLHTDYNSRSLSTFGNFTDAEYDMNNVGKTAIAADKGVGREYYLVMKDENGLYLYSVLPNKASPAGLHQKIENSPDIEKAVAFAASGSLKQVYYGVENKLYLYDILANASRLVFEFGAGTNVKDMEMYKAKVYGRFADPMYNSRLAVATYNGSEGEVYFLNLTSTGDVESNTYAEKFGSFGEIIQINYRNPNE